MTTLAPGLVRTRTPAFGSRADQAVRGLVALLPLATLLAAVSLVHMINMGNYPYFENDEGTYLSQAWALVAEGRLAPYTYWYDHAPAGSVQMGLWSVLTGGFFTFGASIESGRALMLVFQALSAFLVFRIARTISGSWTIAALAVAIFGFSALGIYLHRRVLLDNIATFWMLLSVALVVGPRPTLARAWASAAALGIAILSKEVAVFVVPAMAFLIWVKSHPSQRWLAMIGWLAIVGSMVSLYVLMAALKGELFPTGTLLGGQHPHVSLLGTLQFQAARGKDGGLLQAGSGFWTAALGWAQAEPLLIIGGTAAAVASLALIRSQPVMAAIGMMILSLWLFLGRGGVVIGFYVIPLLPFLALSLALIVWWATQWLVAASGRLSRIRMVTGRGLRTTAIGASLALIVAGYLTPYLGFASRPLQLWQSDEASAQRHAVSWIRSHLPPESNLVIDNYAWLDLRAPSVGPTFELANYYWKVGADPEISEGAFENDWRSADYLMVTPQVIGDRGDPSLVLVNQILSHSTSIRSFDGWPVSISRVNKLQRIDAPSDVMLGSMWSELSATSVRDSAALLLPAIYMNDLETFGSALAAVQAPDRAEVADRAYALLLAGRQWRDQALTAAGSALVRELWVTQTASVGRYRVVASSVSADAATIEIGQLRPEMYRAFAEADLAHDWSSVLDGTYEMIRRAMLRPEYEGRAGVLPDSMMVNRDSGKVIDWADQSTARGMGLAWHLALDWLWSADERARQTLVALDVPRIAFAEHGRLVDSYGLDGAPHSDDETFGSYAAVLGTMLAGDDPEMAPEVLAAKIMQPMLADGARLSASDLSWAWSATALMDGGLSDLWHGDSLMAWPASTQARAVAAGG